MVKIAENNGHFPTLHLYKSQESPRLRSSPCAILSRDENQNKMANQEILRKIFSVGCVLDRTLSVQEYLSALSDDNEKNCEVFSKFASRASSTLLCILEQYGYCGADTELRELLVEHVLTRQAFDHEEDDAGGHIADFVRRHTGKHYR